MPGLHSGLLEFWNKKLKNCYDWTKHFKDPTFEMLLLHILGHLLSLFKTEWGPSLCLCPLLTLRQHGEGNLHRYYLLLMYYKWSETCDMQGKNETGDKWCYMMN